MTRVFDLFTSGVLIVLLSPVLIYRAVKARLSTGTVFVRTPKVGKQHRLFNQLRFAGTGSGIDLAILFNVLRGELAWVGMRALSPEEAAVLPEHERAYTGLNVGVVSAFSVKQKVGLAYDDEFATDSEFFTHINTKHYIGLCVRALIAGLLGGNQVRPTPPVLHFWGVDIVNTTMTEALTWINNRVQQKQKAQIAFVNPGCLNIAYTHKEYRQVLQQVDRVLPDGIGINIGCRLLNQALLANVNGTDLFPRLCEQAAKEGYSLYLLGGMTGVAELTANAMRQRYPDLQIAGFHDGFFSESEEAEIIETINNSGAAILLVGFGVPKQELWLARVLEQLQPTVSLGIGGLFDYYSGRIPRAPVWLREIGMEWSWRLWQEPGRMWRRYLIGNPLFLYRVWLQKQQGVHINE